MPELIYTPYFVYLRTDKDGQPYYGYFNKRSVTTRRRGLWKLTHILRRNILWHGRDRYSEEEPLKLRFEDGSETDISEEERDLLLLRLTQFDTDVDLVEMVLHYRRTGEVKDGICSHLTKPLTPVFGRYPENNNKKTFDYIHTAVPICAVEDKMAFVRERYMDIARYVAADLSNRRSFKRYGVPLNCLRVTDCTLTGDGCLALVFELKEIGKEIDIYE